MQKLSVLGLRVALSASLLMPLSAYAYLTPDQVFGGPSTTVTAPPPPTLRDGDAIAEQRALAGAQRLSTQQIQNVNNSNPVDTYVPPVVSSSKGLFDQNSQYQLRQDRLADEKSAAPTIIIGGNGDIIDTNGNVLHSGAPNVSATGPASVLAAIAMVLAGLCTFGYVQLRSRRFAFTA